MDTDLLADLESLGEEEEQIKSHDDEESIGNVEMEMKCESLGSLTKIFHSPQLEQLLQKIDKFDHRSEYYNSGPIEQDPEYNIVVQSNTLSVELDYEITLVTKVSSIDAENQEYIWSSFP
jgi:U4/U6 small nuclear ribonucleoprotein PRP31